MNRFIHHHHTEEEGQKAKLDDEGEEREGKTEERDVANKEEETRRQIQTEGSYCREGSICENEF